MPSPPSTPEQGSDQRTDSAITASADSGVGLTLVIVLGAVGVCSLASICAASCFFGRLGKRTRPSLHANTRRSSLQQVRVIQHRGSLSEGTTKPNWTTDKSKSDPTLERVCTEGAPTGPMAARRARQVDWRSTIAAAATATSAKISLGSRGRSHRPPGAPADRRTASGSSVASDIVDEDGEEASDERPPMWSRSTNARWSQRTAATAPPPPRHREEIVARHVQTTLAARVARRKGSGLVTWANSTDGTRGSSAAQNASMQQQDAAGVRSAPGKLEGRRAAPSRASLLLAAITLERGTWRDSSDSSARDSRFDNEVDVEDTSCRVSASRAPVQPAPGGLSRPCYGSSFRPASASSERSDEGSRSSRGSQDSQRIDRARTVTKARAVARTSGLMLRARSAGVERREQQSHSQAPVISSTQLRSMMVTAV